LFAATETPTERGETMASAAGDRREITLTHQDRCGDCYDRLKAGAVVFANAADETEWQEIRCEFCEDDRAQREQAQAMATPFVMRWLGETMADVLEGGATKVFMTVDWHENGEQIDDPNAPEGGNGYCMDEYVLSPEIYEIESDGKEFPSLEAGERWFAAHYDGDDDDGIGVMATFELCRE
jgi:hypothetical protein